MRTRFSGTAVVMKAELDGMRPIWAKRGTGHEQIMKLKTKEGRTMTTIHSPAATHEFKAGLGNKPTCTRDKGTETEPHWDLPKPSAQIERVGEETTAERDPSGRDRQEKRLERETDEEREKTENDNKSRASESHEGLDEEDIHAQREDQRDDLQIPPPENMSHSKGEEPDLKNWNQDDGWSKEMVFPYRSMTSAREDCVHSVTEAGTISR